MAELQRGKLCSRKLSVPGRNQQEQLRVQRAGRPHLLRCSEREPKECAGSLLRRGRVPNVTFESNMQQGYRSRGASHKSFASRAFPGRARLSTASTNQRSVPAAERKKRGRTGGPALVCAQRARTKGVCRQQKGRKMAGRAGRDRASALKTLPCRCFSAFPGRTRLPTASTNQRSAPAADRKKTGRTGWP